MAALPLAFPDKARVPLAVMQSVAVFILQASRVPQILLNHARKSTGELRYYGVCKAGARGSSACSSPPAASSRFL